MKFSVLATAALFARAYEQKKVIAIRSQTANFELNEVPTVISKQLFVSVALNLSFLLPLGNRDPSAMH